MKYAYVTYVHNNSTTKKSFNHNLVNYENNVDLIIKFANYYRKILNVIELTEEEFNELNTEKNIADRYLKC